jgi:hypothetical protein
VHARRHVRAEQTCDMALQHQVGCEVHIDMHVQHLTMALNNLAGSTFENESLFVGPIQCEWPLCLECCWHFRKAGEECDIHMMTSVGCQGQDGKGHVSCPGQ